MSFSLTQCLTFADSGLDRAAHLRGDRDVQAGLLNDPGARLLPMWRHKPLVAASDGLGWLAKGQAGLPGDETAPIFLGRDERGPRFAIDMSAWQPPHPPDGPLDAFLDRTEQVHPDFPAGTRFLELRNCMTALTARDAELAATARGLLAWHARHGFCANCGAESDVTMAGWQRYCRRCHATHFPRTDPVVIMLVTHGNSVLLGRSPGWPDRMYSLLAGFVEPGETAEAAVRREVFEESGIRVGAVSYITSQPWPFPASLMMGCRGEALSAEITVDPVEIEDAIWLSREQLLNVFAGTHPRVATPRRGAIAHFLLERWLADRLDEPL